MAKKRSKKARSTGDLVYNIRPAPRIVDTTVKVKRPIGKLTADQLNRYATEIFALSGYGAIKDAKDVLIEIEVPLTDDTWIESGSDWVRVLSTNVLRIKYDQAQRQMRVTFTSGKEYIYMRVLEYVARRQFNASSQGKNVWLWRDKGLVKGVDYIKVG